MDVKPTKLVFITPPRYVLLPAAHLMTGYTVKPIRRKIQRGVWQEGKLWRRALDGRIAIDLDGSRSGSRAENGRLQGEVLRGGLVPDRQAFELTAAYLRVPCRLLKLSTTGESPWLRSISAF